MVGFAEALQGQIDGDGLNQIRYLGVACIVFITILCFCGVDWVIKVQLGLLGFLVICIVAVIVGVNVGSDDSIGYVGISSELFRKNFSPKWGRWDHGDQTVYSAGHFLILHSSILPAHFSSSE